MAVTGATIEEFGGAAPCSSPAGEPPNDPFVVAEDPTNMLPPDHPEVVAWNRAKRRRKIELATVIAAGVAVSVMFGVFCSILTS
jgi:hypothetical protein